MVAVKNGSSQSYRSWMSERSDGVSQFKRNGLSGVNASMVKSVAS